MPLQTTTYYLSSEESGATCTNELTIHVNDPEITASTTYVCDGDSVLLNVGTNHFMQMASQVLRH